jgi:hypothetical protein
MGSNQREFRENNTSDYIALRSPEIGVDKGTRDERKETYMDTKSYY